MPGFSEQPKHEAPKDNGSEKPEKASYNSPDQEQPEDFDVKERKVDLLAEKWRLLEGNQVQFKKIEKLRASDVSEGDIVGGRLRDSVSLGSPIKFKDNSGVISDVQDLQEVDDDLLIYSSTSIYRLESSPRKIQESLDETKPENLSYKDVSSVVTQKGSVYKYLPDGRTQRYQTAKKELHEPQNALVYIPDWDWVKEYVRDESYLEKLGENSAQYNQNILRYVQTSGKKAYIVNSEGKKLETNEDIKSEESQVYLVFLERNAEEIDISVPVSHIPKQGFKTFDTRKYRDEETGEMMRTMHIGNSVKEINWRK